MSYQLLESTNHHRVIFKINQ